MGIDITRQNLSNTIFIFILLFVIFLFGERVSASFSLDPNMDLFMPLGVVANSVIGYGRAISSALSFLLLIFIFFGITRIVIQNMVYPDYSYMPIIIYAVISTGILFSPLSYIVLFSSFLFVLALDQIMKSYKKGRAVDKYFEASVLIGIASLFYAPAAISFLVIPVALASMRYFSWREWFVSFAGFMLPATIYGYIEWISGGKFSNIFDFYRSKLFFTNDLSFPVFKDVSFQEWLFLLLVVSLVVLAVISFINNGYRLRKRPKKCYSIFLWLLLVKVIMFLLPCRSFHMLPFLAVPLSVIIPAYFANPRKSSMLSNSLYVVFLLFAILLNFWV